MNTIEEFNERGVWGLSTHLDLYYCDPKLIKDMEYIRKFIEDVVEFLDMLPHGEIFIDRFGNEPHLEGISFSQMIKTSCITGHFAENEDAAYIDVFSCKAYEPEELAEYCMAYFNAGSHKMRYLFRE